MEEDREPSSLTLEEDLGAVAVEEVHDAADHQSLVVQKEIQRFR
jgi:hypothetical protein